MTLSLAGSPAVFLVRRLCGGVAEWRSSGVAGLPAMFVEGWPADHLLTASFRGGRIRGLRMTLSISCFRTFVPSSWEQFKSSKVNN
jgi:hypothetical protein